MRVLFALLARRAGSPMPSSSQFGLGGDGPRLALRRLRLQRADPRCRRWPAPLAPCSSRAERLAWAVMALGLAAWTGGELYWTLALADLDSPPYPVPVGRALPGPLPVRLRDARAADPGARDAHHAAASGWTARSARSPSRRSRPRRPSARSSPAPRATSPPWPRTSPIRWATWSCSRSSIGVFGVCGWQPGPRLAADRPRPRGDGGRGRRSTSSRAPKGTYVRGQLLDAGWPAAALLIAGAAWQPRRARASTWSSRALRAILVPTLCALVALGVLVSARRPARRSATTWPWAPCCS